MCALSAEQIAGLGFEQVVDAAAVSIVVVDASGKVIHSNERARALTAELGSEMPADLDQAIDIFHPDGRRYEHDEWPAVRSLTSGEEIVEEFFYAVPGGGRLWIRCSSWPVRDAAGEIVAAALTMTDVTERRREEARLAYLAGLLDNTEDAIVAFDDEWLVTVWNRGAERLYGRTADEMLGRRATDVVRVELSDEQKLDARRAAAEGGRWRAEVTAYHQDGTPVPVEAITVALRGTQGEITGYLAIHRDITERQRMLDELRESQQQSETILESITDAAVAMDRDWRYVYANDRALARFAAWRGMPVRREDIIGKSAWELSARPAAPRPSIACARRWVRLSRSSSRCTSPRSTTGWRCTRFRRRAGCRSTTAVSRRAGALRRGCTKQSNSGRRRSDDSTTSATPSAAASPATFMTGRSKA
jgi:PAS domain S-box-containing protein